MSSCDKLIDDMDDDDTLSIQSFYTLVIAQGNGIRNEYWLRITSNLNDKPLWELKSALQKLWEADGNKGSFIVDLN